MATSPSTTWINTTSSRTALHEASFIMGATQRGPSRGSESARSRGRSIGSSRAGTRHCTWYGAQLRRCVPQPWRHSVEHEGTRSLRALRRTTRSFEMRSWGAGARHPAACNPQGLDASRNAWYSTHHRRGRGRERCAWKESSCARLFRRPCAMAEATSHGRRDHRMQPR
ncbi:hypothetical protein D3C87_1642170 [compost metagenome]